jgi:hypothetical protein
LFPVKTSVDFLPSKYPRSPSFGTLSLDIDSGSPTAFGLRIDEKGVSVVNTGDIYQLYFTDDFFYIDHSQSSGIESIVSITVDGIAYKIRYDTSDFTEVKIGESIFEPQTNRIAVSIDRRLNPNFSLQSSVIAYRYIPIGLLQSISIKSNVICNHPAIAILDALNVDYADITLNETMGEPPSLSAINFAICPEDEDWVVGSIKNGTEFAAMGHKWVIEKVSTSYSPQISKTVVSIQPVHWSVSRSEPSICPLDKPVLIKKYSSVSAIANQSRAKYYGIPFAQKLKRSIGSEDTTTLREMLDSRLITKGHLPFYTQDYIDSFAWGNSPIKTISTSEIVGEEGGFLETTAIAGNGRSELGVQLFSEYRNVKIELDREEKEDDPEKAGVTTRWAFDGCTSFADMVSDAEFKGSYSVTPNPDVLRNPGICFDNGGRTKKATKITELNGTITFQEDWEYGYAFTSLDVYEIAFNSEGNLKIKFIGSFSSTYWKEVAHSTTNYIYDGLGYLQSVVKTGYQSARMSQESEKLEAITLLFKAVQSPTQQGGISVPDPSLVNQSNSYKFDKKLPISEVTNYTLHSHASYFKDAVKPSDACDRDFVPPKFVASKVTTNSTQIIAKNPKNNEFYTYPDLVTGKFSIDSETTTVINRHYPYAHEVRVSSQNSEGAYGKNAIALSSVTQSVGQPSAASRLDKSVRKLPNVVVKDESRYFINASNPVTQEGTIGYPDIDQVDDVARIARIEQSIKNTKNAYTKTFSIMFRNDLNAGDRVIFKNRLWVLLAIADSRQIRKDFATSTDLNITLGLFLNPSLRVSNRSAVNDCPPEKSDSQSVSLSRPIDFGLPPKSNDGGGDGYGY